MASYFGHLKVAEEVIYSDIDGDRFPINVFARNAEGKTPRQSSKGNLVMNKIFRKAERRSLHSIFEVKRVSEAFLLSNSHSTKKIHYLTYPTEEERQKNQVLIHFNYHSLKNQLRVIRHKHKFSVEGGSMGVNPKLKGDLVHMRTF